MKHFLKTVIGAIVGTIVALVLLIFIGIGIIGSIASSSESEPVVPKKTILRIDLSTPVAEQAKDNFSIDFMSGNADMSSSISLLKAVKAIEAAAEDPAVSFIYMTTDGMTLSVQQMEELREALVHFRASGKPVISYSKTVSTHDYYMASVADKVIANTYADCMFAGLSTTVMYFKDIIDRLGINVQLIRHGKYKSAGEPFIKNEMSAENREQYEVMLGTMWNTLTEGIASSREFSAEDFKYWVDELKIGSIQDAKDMGIVDELWFDDQVEDYLCTLFEVKKAKDLKFTSLKDYATVMVKQNLRVKDKIAVIYADGDIVMGDNKDGQIGDNFAKTIAKVRQDSTVKAVVFRVNSPGGSVQASAIIEREIALLKQVKPVVASYGVYAASGGYWISCGCNKIFSDRTTLTGSIGVFGLIPSFGAAIEKNLHIKTFEVSTSKHGALADAMNPLDKEEVAWMQNNIENVYSDFVGRVASGRNLDVAAVDAIAQGRVWAGGDALVLGLVDEIGSLNTAISYAAASVDLEKYRIVEYPAVKTMFERLSEQLSKTSEVSVTPLNSIEKASQWLMGVSEPVVTAKMENIIIY